MRECVHPPPPAPEVVPPSALLRTPARSRHTPRVFRNTWRPAARGWATLTAVVAVKAAHPLLPATKHLAIRARSAQRLRARRGPPAAAAQPFPQCPGREAPHAPAETSPPPVPRQLA